MIRCLRFVGVDDRDGAMRVVHQTAADRTQQCPADRTHAPAADDDHLRLFGRVDKRRHDVVMQHLRVHRRRLSLAQAGVQCLLCLLDHVLCVLLLPLVVASLQRRDGPADNHRHYDVREGEWCVVQYRFAGCPADGGIGLGRTVDSYQNSVLRSGFRHFAIPLYGRPRRIGAVYFFEYRAAMYVLSTAITAMTIAIKTAAVGQSMALLPSLSATP